MTRRGTVLAVEALVLGSASLLIIALAFYTVMPFLFGGPSGSTTVLGAYLCGSALVLENRGAGDALVRHIYLVNASQGAYQDIIWTLSPANGTLLVDSGESMAFDLSEQGVSVEGVDALVITGVGFDAVVVEPGDACG